MTDLALSRLSGTKVQRPFFSRIMTSSTALAVSSESTTTWKSLLRQHEPGRMGSKGAHEAPAVTSTAVLYRSSTSKRS